MRRYYSSVVFHKMFPCVSFSAKGYLSSDPSGREGVPMTTIQQGEELLSFKGWFHAWDDKLWDKDILQYIQQSIKKD